MTVEHMPSSADMFNALCEISALVCPVNCVGVLGAGLARIFASRYQLMVEPYKRACENGDLVIGKLLVIGVESVGSGDGWDIVCVPTKDDWRNKSNLADVLAGIDALAAEATARLWDSIAIPALGCGLGGLQWGPVKQALDGAFLLHSTHVLIYPPRQA